MSKGVLDPFSDEEAKPFAVLALPGDIAKRDVLVGFDMEGGSTKHDSAFGIGIAIADKATGEPVGAYRVIYNGPHLKRFAEGKFDMDDRTEKWWSEQQDTIGTLLKLAKPDTRYEDLYRMWVTVMNLVHPATEVVTDAAAFDAQVLASVSWNCGSPFMLGTDKIIRSKSIYSCVDEVCSGSTDRAVSATDRLRKFRDSLGTGAHDPLFDACCHLVNALRRDKEAGQS